MLSDLSEHCHESNICFASTLQVKERDGKQKPETPSGQMSMVHHIGHIVFLMEMFILSTAATNNYFYFD